ncbi:TetR/AcrR family transcriptional regulator [Rhizobium sp. BT03]|uniref:TetR/AcrR family transcriptional regulator n=1 Tax=Rhizobium sp. BT03 TaxID=3045156 RepID=UPI0024B3D6C9|nr:TetR/AcrR family transcriptional regulator [Rhizobium sp. BT03]WHO75428.1 TetR/AcrR family transcriptional regulator [Rhizobium sp. BT03]
MARLTREQSQARTRNKLLESAYQIMARFGYGGASIERIAEDAGFSKGAFYSNFVSKEDIFIQLLEDNAGRDVAELTELLDKYDNPEELIDVLANWASERGGDRRWGLLAIELLRRAQDDEMLGDRQIKLFRDQWEGVGNILIRKLGLAPRPPASAFYIGGIVLELTYSGISSFLKDGAPGVLLKIVLGSMYRDSHRANATTAVSK